MWSLYEKGKFLAPLVFSNGKSQEDVVREVLEEIKKGEKVIFIRGACGTGKSAIALNLSKELGKSSIVVPGKNLQRQYKKDYEEEKYVLKKDGSKLSRIRQNKTYKPNWGSLRGALSDIKMSSVELQHATSRARIRER